ncbi:hypothetical protein [Persicobacter psychrovividus]|uniref:Tyrosine kinase G-rich domain-containing protein n=1 Tax=Persicobacter psychrovividus TaxID=387638 RepID=A0ABM7VEI1_9BACT|nr:hypothetical protein PEPS_16270 [Persicobacter psychrovividus]
MELINLIRLLTSNWRYLVFLPVLVTAGVIYATKGEVRSFTTSSQIYTGLASGYDIETHSEDKFNYKLSQVIFDNAINLIKTDKMAEEVSIRLMAQHLAMPAPDHLIVKDENWSKAKKLFTPAFSKKYIKVGNAEQTYENLKKVRYESVSNEVIDILQSEHPFYGIEKLKSYSVKRLQGSDLIKFEYSNTDPGVAQNVLLFLGKAFEEIYNHLKARQAKQVVKYFQAQLDSTYSALTTTEEDLMNLKADNQILLLEDQLQLMEAKKDELIKGQEHLELELSAKKAQLKSMNVSLPQTKNASNTNRQSANVIKIKNQLTDDNFKLSLLELTTADVEVERERLTQRIERNQKKLEASIDLGKVRKMPQGSNKELAAELIANIASLEARLRVTERIIGNFYNNYRSATALKLEINKMERRITIAQENYFALLKDLQRSKTKLKNLSVSHSITVVDYPFYPVNPDPSMRKLLIVAGFAGTLIFVVSIIIVGYLFDASIATIAKAEKLAKSEVVGGMPDMSKIYKEVVIHKVKSKLIKQLEADIQQTKTAKQLSTMFISVVSLRPQEGKSRIAYEIAQKLSAYNKVLLIRNGSTEGEPRDIRSKNLEAWYYSTAESLNQSKDMDKFLENPLIQEEYDFIILELGAILNFDYPIQLLAKSDHNFLVIDSHRSWSEADGKSIDKIKKLKQVSFDVILNNIDLFEAEKLISELPKKRTRFRQTIKNIIQFKFRNNKFWVKSKK